MRLTADRKRQKPGREREKYRDLLAALERRSVFPLVASQVLYLQLVSSPHPLTANQRSEINLVAAKLMSKKFLQDDDLLAHAQLALPDI